MSCFRGLDVLPLPLRPFSIAYILLVILFALGCHSAGRDASAIILTLIDQGWPGSDPDDSVQSSKSLQDKPVFEFRSCPLLKRLWSN